MIKKLKNYLIIMASTAMLAIPAFVPATASAATGTTLGGGACTGATNLTLPDASGSLPSAQTCGNNSTSSFNNIIKDAVNIFSVIVGVIAVIMIIVGGFKYITSGGESNNVSSAKNTILFAIVGLIIVALAQVIVHFVLGRTSDLASSTLLNPGTWL